MIQVYACQGMKFYRDALIKMGFKPYLYPDKPALFLGTYNSDDVVQMLLHNGPGYVFWNGTDALHLKNHPEWSKVLRDLPHVHAAHHQGLADEVHSILGHKVEVSPTLFREPADFPVCFKRTEPVRFYMNTHAGRHEEYGVLAAMDIFGSIPGKDIELCVYGDRPPYTPPNNVHFMGRYPESIMDTQTSQMQGALRLNKHDGTSQIVIKSLLWGQWPVVTKWPTEALSKLLDYSTMNVPNRSYIPGLNAFIDRLRREHASQ